MSPVAFAGVRVFDGVAMLQDQTVLVVRGRISARGPASEVERPLDARVVDGAGRTLLPGFVDAHVHIGFYDPKTVLRGGVTAARDLAWPPERIFSLARRLAGRATEGPLLIAAGPMITAPGGYPTRASWAPAGTGLEVRTEAEAATAVADLAARGAGVIKVAQEPREGPVLPEEVLRAVVQEAHAAGLRVTSHLGSLGQLKAALDAGVDELAHGLWSDEEIPQPLVERMTAQGLTVVPTLHIDPTRVRIDNLGRFVAAGGRVVYGTDMGNTGPPLGIDPEELRLMVEAGMTSLEALAAATSGAADYLGLRDRGRIAPGAAADLVLVEGDPSRNFEALAQPLLVMREGRAVG